MFIWAAWMEQLVPPLKINLFCVADSATYQNEIKLVKLFLKGSKEAKEKIQKDHPDM